MKWTRRRSTVLSPGGGLNIPRTTWSIVPIKSVFQIPALLYGTAECFAGDSLIWEDDSLLTLACVKSSNDTHLNSRGLDELHSISANFVIELFWDIFPTFAVKAGSRKFDRCPSAYLGWSRIHWMHCMFQKCKVIFRWKYWIHVKCFTTHVLFSQTRTSIMNLEEMPYAKFCYLFCW